MPDLGIPAMRHGFEAKVELFRMEQVPCFDSERLVSYGRQREVDGMAKTENPISELKLHNWIVFSQKCYNRVNLMLSDVAQPVISRWNFLNTGVVQATRAADTTQSTPAADPRPSTGARVTNITATTQKPTY